MKTIRTSPFLLPSSDSNRAFTRTWIVRNLNTMYVAVWHRHDHFAYPPLNRVRLAECQRLNPTFLDTVKPPIEIEIKETYGLRSLLIDAGMIIALFAFAALV